MLSFTEALAEEVRGSGVRVSCLAPGATGTGFAAQAGMGSTRLFRWGVMDAGRVARAGHDGLRRAAPLVIPGLLNQAFAFSVRARHQLVSGQLYKRHPQETWTPGYPALLSCSLIGRRPLLLSHPVPPGTSAPLRSAYHPTCAYPRLVGGP